MGTQCHAGAQGPDSEAHAKGRRIVLDELRGLWAEAKAARDQAMVGQIELATARMMSQGVMDQLELLADRIKSGDVTPLEALALLGRPQDAEPEWLS